MEGLGRSKQDARAGGNAGRGCRGGRAPGAGAPGDEAQLPRGIRGCRIFPGSGPAAGLLRQYQRIMQASVIIRGSLKVGDGGKQDFMCGMKYVLIPDLPVTGMPVQ